MVMLYDFDRVVGLYGDDFDFNAYSVCVLSEFLACKLPSSVYNELIG